MTSKLDPSRRDLLRGLGGLALTTVACGTEDDSTADDPATSSIASASIGVSVIAAVANRAQPVMDIQAYAQKSVVAGDTIDFHVSIPSSGSYKIDVVRLGWSNDGGQSQDWIVSTSSNAPAAQQPIHPGSYIHVNRALLATAECPQLTLECWVRPFRLGWQGLISQYTYGGSGGFGLFISDDGRPACYFGDGGAFNATYLCYGTTAIDVFDPTLTPAPVWNGWSHIVAVFNGGTVRLYLNGARQTSATIPLSKVTPGTSPLRIGAYGDESGTIGFLDGDLAMPIIYSRALSDSEVQRRFQCNLAPALDGDVEGCWELSEENGPIVVDSGLSGRTGTIVNRGTWMIGGPRFDSLMVPQFDTDRGHGLRLSSSDLYDAAWPVGLSCPISSDCRPGLYVGRITYGAQVYDVPFVVRRATTRPPAPIVVLCNTNTWHAYSAPFGSFSFYERHKYGQPTYFVGINMPWSLADLQSPHLLPAERLLHVWLEQNGYDYDMISDRDLHLDSALLGQYRALIIAGHSEYWTREMYEGVTSYLANGRNLVCMSGNTMFWRVSCDAGVIECRKITLSNAVVTFRNIRFGEAYHEHDLQRGGLMREVGYPAWDAVGTECVAIGGETTQYVVSHASHEFFLRPESTGLNDGDPVGLVVGESDTTLAQIPPGFNPVVPAYYNPCVLAQASLITPRFDYRCSTTDTNNTPYDDGIVSEMIDWQRTGGGRVFTVGVIGATQGLQDSGFAVTVRNALHHMGVVFKLNVTAVTQGGHVVNKSFDGMNYDSTWLDWSAGFQSVPAGVMFEPGNRAVMAITTEGHFYYRSFSGGAWSDWSDLGAGYQGQPAAVAWARNKLTLFARGLNNHVYGRTWDGATWSTWLDLGGGIASDVSAVVTEGNRLNLAVRGAAGNILFKQAQAGAWSPSQSTWIDLGGNFAQAPTLYAWGGNILNVFAVNSSGLVSYKTGNGISWSGWQDIGVGPIASRLAVAGWGPYQFTLFGRGSDGRIKNKWWGGGAWGPSLTGWADDLGGSFIGDPAATTFRGRWIDLVAIESSTNSLKHTVWSGTAWSGWVDLGGSSPGGGVFQGSPTIFPWM